MTSLPLSGVRLHRQRSTLVLVETKRRLHLPLLLLLLLVSAWAGLFNEAAALWLPLLMRLRL